MNSWLSKLELKVLKFRDNKLSQEEREYGKITNYLYNSQSIWKKKEFICIFSNEYY